MQHLLERLACTAWRIEEQQAGRLNASAVPSVRHLAVQGSGVAGAADADLITDLEGDLAGENVSDLVACVVGMKISNGPDRRNFLEHHHPLGGLVVLQLQRE